MGLVVRANLTKLEVLDTLIAAFEEAERRKVPQCVCRFEQALPDGQTAYCAVGWLSHELGGQDIVRAAYEGGLTANGLAFSYLNDVMGWTWSKFVEHFKAEKAKLNDRTIA